MAGMAFAGDVKIGITEVTSPVAYLPGWAIWPRFTATWTDPRASVTLTIEVTEGVPRCIGVEVSASQVDGTLLRSVPVRGLVERAVRAATMRVDVGGSAHLFKTPEEAASLRGITSAMRQRKRWQLTPELLTEVAQVYRQATAAPVLAVAEHFKRNRPTASRWVAKARDEGYLGQEER